MKSKVVRLGLTASLAISLAACASDDDDAEVRADHHRICVDNDQVRVEDTNCPDDDSDGHFFHPYWIYGSHSAPGVGSKVVPGSYSTVKPTSGTIARPPAKGGFGTFRSGSVGG